MSEQPTGPDLEAAHIEYVTKGERLDDVEREADCIRAMLNYARDGVTTWAGLRKRMRADGWTDEESKAALIQIDPEILPPSPKERDQ